MTKRIRETDVNDSVRTFLNEAFAGGGVVVEDETGHLRGSVVPFYEASPEERAAAWQRLQALQQRVSDRLAAEGKTEEELDRILQEDE